LEIYISIFRKNNSTLIQSRFDGICTDDTGDVAVTLPKHLHTTYSYTSPPLSSIPVYCSDFLPLVPSTDFVIPKAVKRLRPTKSVKPDDICGLLLRDCRQFQCLYLEHFQTECITAALTSTVKTIRNLACLYAM